MWDVYLGNKKKYSSYFESEIERDLKIGRRFSSGSNSGAGASNFGTSHWGASHLGASHLGSWGAGISGMKIGLDLGLAGNGAWKDDGTGRESGLADSDSRSDPELAPVEVKPPRECPSRETTGDWKLIPLAGSEFHEEI